MALEQAERLSIALRHNFPKLDSVSGMAQKTPGEYLRRVKSSNTTPEILVRKALWRKGLRYRIHHPGFQEDLTLSLQEVRSLSLCMVVIGTDTPAQDHLPQRAMLSSGGKSSNATSKEMQETLSY